ncbi:hypothetical protein D5R81_16055 [Parashewanella spongiae]|uniref:Uncharacterized protein n=1 Tax=Parashewanella spongiae TaxID=342950 RepID=A0A3A6TG05_9GAMM|nr:hypothetical protein [Parashewanella spongiae]MCL1079601.1 hypothetical protein [Parashewanella spongiae]RJY07344.1 hypothetical protein D5R81_16055 [Parashewanella spongiae]
MSTPVSRTIQITSVSNLAHASAEYFQSQGTTQTHQDHEIPLVDFRSINKSFIARTPKLFSKETLRQALAYYHGGHNRDPTVIEKPSITLRQGSTRCNHLRFTNLIGRIHGAIRMDDCTSTELEQITFTSECQIDNIDEIKKALKENNIPESLKNLVLEAVPVIAKAARLEGETVFINSVVLRYPMNRASYRKLGEFPWHKDPNSLTVTCVLNPPKLEIIPHTQCLSEEITENYDFAYDKNYTGGQLFFGTRLPCDEYRIFALKPSPTAMSIRSETLVKLDYLPGEGIMFENIVSEHHVHDMSVIQNIDELIANLPDDDKLDGEIDCLYAHENTHSLNRILISFFLQLTPKQLERTITLSPLNNLAIQSESLN